MEDRPGDNSFAEMDVRLKVILSPDEVVERWHTNKYSLARWIIRGGLICYSISEFRWCDPDLGSQLTIPCGTLSSDFFSSNSNFNYEILLKNWDDIIFRNADILEFEKKFGLDQIPPESPGSARETEAASKTKVKSGEDSEEQPGRSQESRYKRPLPFEHFDDLRKIKVKGKTYLLTPRESAIMKILADDYLSGGEGVLQNTIVKEMGRKEGTRLRDLFEEKNRPVWTQLTEPVPGSQGFRRIKEGPVDRKEKKRPKK